MYSVWLSVSALTQQCLLQLQCEPRAHVADAVIFTVREVGEQVWGLGAARKIFAYYGLFGRFSLRKHDLSVCFSVHIIKVKPDEKQRLLWYGRVRMQGNMGNRGHTTIGTIDVMCVLCFINIIKQKHIICRRKFLIFSIFKSKFLKGCSLKIPYMYASIYQTNREKWNIVWHLIVNPCTSYIIKPWSTFLSCLYIH